MYKFGILATLGWFVVLIALVYGGQSLPAAWLGLLSGLAPNEVGDMLAGVFAPIAFLWFFISTYMQRQELRLQREELAETRKVLADQQAELERTAKESAAQTDIMTKTLESARARETYEEFSLHLYYLAFLLKRCSKLTITFGENGYEQSVWFLALPNHLDPTGQDHASVDRVFLEAREWLEHLPSNIQPPFNVADQDAQAQNNRVQEVLAQVETALDQLLVQSASGDNTLIHARVEGIGLRDFRQSVAKLRQHFLTRRTSGSSLDGDF